MEKILEQFGIQPILLIAQIVNFVILLFILKKFLYGPILKVLETRRLKIAESLKNAEDIEKKLAQTEEDREKALEKAAKEAQRILDEAKSSATQVVADAHGKASQDIEDLMKKGQEQLKVERDKMQQEIRNELSNLVVLALEKVIGKTVTTKDQKELIERTIKGL